MSDLIPLIVNVGSGQIQELPSGDNLDLTGSNISNVGNITVASYANVNTIRTDNYQYANGDPLSAALAGNATGNIDMNGFNLDLSTFNETVNPSNVSFTSGDTFFDASLGTVQIYDVAYDLTLWDYNISNVPVGGSFVMLLNIQSGGEGKYINGNFKFADFANANVTRTTSSTVGDIDMICAVNINGTYYATLTKGYGV